MASILPATVRNGLAGLTLLALLSSCAVAPEAQPTPPASAASAPAPTRSRADPALTGTWIPVLAELAGQEFKFGQEFRLTVSGDRYEVAGAPQRDAGRLEFIDGDPRGFDVIGEEGPTKGQRYLAIYRILPDGRLEACYDLDGVGRPAAFSTLPGTKLFRVIYRRR